MKKSIKLNQINQLNQRFRQMIKQHEKINEIKTINLIKGSDK